MADEGSTSALAEIGNIYEVGGGGVTQDFAKAREWYERSSMLGDPDGHIGLARMYYFGLGVEQNDAKALDLFQKAHAADATKAGVVYALGVLFELGRGTAKDDDRAIEYYLRAAAMGHALALKNLAVLRIVRGDRIGGIFLWCRALVRIFSIALKDPNDPRLKVR